MSAWIRSALTTFIAVGAGVAAFAAAGVVSVPAGWVAGLAVVLSVARTVLAALDPGNPSFGVGSPQTLPVDGVIVEDPSL